MGRYEVCIGSYGEMGQDGILRCAIDTDHLNATILARYTGAVRPSSLARSRRGVLYAVREQSPEGGVIALGEGRNGFTLLGVCASGGADPCHLCLDPSERFLFVSNYTSGSIAMLELNEAGVLQEIVCCIQHTGSSAHPRRQGSAHVHFSRLEGDTLYVCDLGQDAIIPYHVDWERKRLTAVGEALRVPGGSGVRHLCYAPGRKDRMYAVGELDANLYYWRHTDGRWNLVQCAATLPDGVPGCNLTAAIHASDDGRFLFVSNRGADSVTVFALEQDGTVRLSDVCAVGGRTPRDFAVLGDTLLVACQNDSCLCMLRLNRISGKLHSLDWRFHTVQPTCVLPVQTSVPES